MENNIFIDTSVIFRARPLKFLENEITNNVYNILKFHTKTLTTTKVLVGAFESGLLLTEVICKKAVTAYLCVELLMPTGNS